MDEAFYPSPELLHAGPATTEGSLLPGAAAREILPHNAERLGYVSSPPTCSPPSALQLLPPPPRLDGRPAASAALLRCHVLAAVARGGRPADGFLQSEAEDKNDS